MPHVTMEYMIMVPVLILQVLLFPLTTSWLMNVWVDSRRELALQDIANHLASTIQQLYFILSHESMSSAENVTQASNVPPYVEDYPYTGVGTLRAVSEFNSSKVLEITLSMKNVANTATASVLLGENVVWVPSTFISDSANACIKAAKIDGVVTLSFGEV